MKTKIAIVAGELLQPRFLRLFEPLAAAFDVCVFALDHGRVLELHGTSLKLRLFENIPDMPGYMRGLEEELAGVGLVIGVETSRLATFQAVRAARKFSVPMCVVASEFTPFFYERFQNIRAIQFDICNKAEKFWVTSEAAGECLRLDEVPDESIEQLPVIIDTGRFKPSRTARSKFRNYVGLGEQDLVVLCQGDLEPWNRPVDVLEALQRVQKQLGPRALPLKVLFAGTGSMAMDLKYRAYDAGLGRQVLFLHQDPEPFLQDLYAAADVMWLPDPLKNEFHEEFPLKLLEAMASGMIPLVGAGSIAAELAGGVGSTFTDSSHLGLQFQRLLTSTNLLGKVSEQAAALVRSRHDIESVGPKFVADVEEVMTSVRRLVPARVVNESLKDEALRDLERGSARDALVKVEEALLLTIPLPSDRADIFRVKGDAYYALGDIEAAGQAYAEGLQLGDRNVLCLRGLGFVAWQGHANEEALTYFKRSLAVQGDDGETMLGIGLVYRRLGLSEEALFWLERCVTAHAVPAAIVALAQTCAQFSRPTEAVAALERALEVLGEQHTLMMTLGQLYLAEGRIVEGSALLEKALTGTAKQAA